MTAGYSKRSLAEKLGLKAGTEIIALDAPPRRSELERAFPPIDAALVDDGIAWISWPKQASGKTTDLTEDVVRAVGLPLGLVDVKVCAVDEVWSGLKFVRRKAQRG